MKTKHQSDRLARQHKNSHGVCGIFDSNAKILDANVSNTSQEVLKKINRKIQKFRI